jgi:hypothetical protein
MSSFDAIHDYYAGQRIVAIAGALVALVYVLLASEAITRPAHFARAFGITALVIAGGFMLPVNVAYFFYVGPQSARIESMLSRNPVELHASEETHLDTMMRGFHRSYRLDGTVAMLGVLLAVFGFIVRNSKLAGIGLAISLCAMTLLAGEIWSKQRALNYREELQAVEFYK